MGSEYAKMRSARIAIRNPDYFPVSWLSLKGLEDIELLAINLADKPKWYLEKVYPVGKVLYGVWIISV